MLPSTTVSKQAALCHPHLGVFFGVYIVHMHGLESGLTAVTSRYTSLLLGIGCLFHCPLLLHVFSGATLGELRHLFTNDVSFFAMLQVNTLIAESSLCGILLWC